MSNLNDDLSLNDTRPSFRTIRSVCPATHEVLAEFPCATEEQVQDAVSKAWHYFECSSFGLDDRLAAIMRLRKIIARRADEIASLISREVGKPITEAYTSEIAGVLDTCVWLAGNAQRLLARQHIKLANPLAWSKTCYLDFEPLGVIGIISPWNFPFSIPMTTVLHALVAGNAVVLKPSEKSTLTGMLIAELIEEAKFPSGAFQIVTGDRETGAALTASKLGRLMMTGSVEAGQKIMAQVASRLTPLTLELGGKDAAVVLPDAPVDFTARGIVWGAFTNAGQACASIERLYIVRGARTDALIAAIVKRVRNLRLGPPQSPMTDLGPLVDRMQLEKVQAQVEEALASGARALTGGTETLGKGKGNYFEPTVLLDVNHDMRIMKDETFGPVLPIMIVSSTSEAIKLANDSDFGLTASVWSSDTARAENIASRLRAGTVYVNDCIFSHAAPQLPWGGLGKSGIGRSHSHIGLMDMVHIKNINVDSASGKGRLWWFPYGESCMETMKSGVQLMHGTVPSGRIKGLVGFLRGLTGKR